MWNLATQSGHRPILAVAWGPKNKHFIFFERLAMIQDKQPFRNIIVIMESYIQFFL